MKRIKLKELLDCKNKKIITCLTSYTSSIAKIIDNHVDIILVGDSLGPVIYGMKNTQLVTMELMKNHGKTVVQASKKAFIIVDLPYNSYTNKKKALINAKEILNYTKCQAIKLEVDENNINIVSHLIKNKIKVISHIGVKPQKYKNFKNIRSVGKTLDERTKLIDLAKKLESIGSSMILLECVKTQLSKEITSTIKIPTIGIGSSVHCDGQILVIDDLLNFDNTQKKPRFIKSYINLSNAIELAVKKYSNEVINKKFPKRKNSY